MKKRLNITFWILYIFSVIEGAAEEAFVAVPIAELLGKPMKSLLQEKTKKQISNDNIIKAYSSIPKIADENPSSCPRIYQLLFNERVMILEQRGPEVKIEVPYALYADAQTGKLSGIYWTLKNNLLAKNDVGEKTFTTAIPPAINNPLHSKKTIVLKKPFFSPTTRQMYSAGTRFVYQYTANKKRYAITFYNPKIKKIVTSTVPISLCIASPSSKHEAYTNYVSLLRQWAKDAEQNPAPYVWGGASLRNAQTPPSKKTIISGFDCAGLIIRAAQSASVPFFFKNSSAVKHHLKECKDGNIKNGDIIWFPGHVMVISDKDKNLVLEARGYSSGYGKVHELPLSKVFKNIYKYEQLLEHYKKKKPLELLDNAGKVSSKIKCYKILLFPYL